MKKLKTFLMLLSALILTTLPSVAQNRVRVQGSVKDANGEPLIGAMVLVKGTQNGAMTDASGNYSISGVANGATLTASLLGYEEQSIKFTGQSTVDFALNEATARQHVAIGRGLCARRRTERRPHDACHPLQGCRSVISLKEKPLR